MSEVFARETQYKHSLARGPGLLCLDRVVLLERPGHVADVEFSLHRIVNEDGVVDDLLRGVELRHARVAVLRDEDLGQPRGHVAERLVRRVAVPVALPARDERPLLQRVDIVRVARVRAPVWFAW